jgi:hypothetical protein
MLILSVLLITMAVLLGIYLLTFILQNKSTPKGVAFTHGPLASLGLILLIIYAFVQGPDPIISIIIFIIAALGGLVLIFRDLTGKSLPKWMAIGHGAIAAIGYILLLKFVFFH